jgi:hypothetical protein
MVSTVNSAIELSSRVSAGRLFRCQNEAVVLFRIFRKVPQQSASNYAESSQVIIVDIETRVSSLDQLIQYSRVERSFQSSR